MVAQSFRAILKQEASSPALPLASSAVERGSASAIPRVHVRRHAHQQLHRGCLPMRGSTVKGGPLPEAVEGMRTARGGDQTPACDQLAFAVSACLGFAWPTVVVPPNVAVRLGYPVM